MEDTVSYIYTHFKDSDPGLPTIFIDFDYTISNFGDLKSEILTNCIRIGITEEEWRSTHDAAKNHYGIYDTEKHIGDLKLSHNEIPPETISKSFFGVYEDSKKFVYPDVVPFLIEIQGKFNIYLLTLGIEDFQFVKRKNSGIDQYLTGVFNTTGHKSTAVADIFSGFGDVSKKQVIFIDDKAKYFAEFDPVAKKYPDSNPVYIWINRPGAKYSQFLPSPDIANRVVEIDDLSKLITLGHIF